MDRQKLLAYVLSFAVLVYGLASPAVAADGRATFTALDETTYAQREAASSHVEDFAGGSDALGVIAVILVVALIVYLVWYWYDHEHGTAMATPEETEAVMLGAVAAAPCAALDNARPADIECLAPRSRGDDGADETEDPEGDPVR